MTIGERIKAKRKEKNISVEYVAKALGVFRFLRYTDMKILRLRKYPSKFLISCVRFLKHPLRS